MVRFAQSEYLYFLLLLPVLGAAYWGLLLLRIRSLGRFANPEILPKLAGEASLYKRHLKMALLLGGIALLCFGLANPQVGTRIEEVKQEGVDLFIALDVSLSMKAEDLRPNRLEKAKLSIRNLIDRLRGDRVGLIVFAGEAFTQFPLTTDYGAAYLFLDVVDIDAVPLPGTSIGLAIERAMDGFNFEEPTTKVVVVITDGENTEGDAFAAATDAAAKGVRLYTIGMGSPAGSPIPIYDASGRQSDFKRDRSGNVVITKLDETGLQRIADIGSGAYYRATGSQDELNAIYESINALQKREFGVSKITDYEDRFQYFLGAAILFLLAELLVSERKSAWIARWGILRAKEEAE